MKIRLHLVSLFSALLVAGCGKNDASTSASASNNASTASTAAAPAKNAGPHTFELTANDQMKFVYDGKDSTQGPLRLEAKAGEDIKIVLTNAGTLPKEAMGHNIVILKPGTDVNAFAAAASTAKDKDYVPDSMKDQVVGHTPVLGPRKSDEVNLKGLAAGEYPFICSFPGHFVNMKGTLVVQ